MKTLVATLAVILATLTPASAGQSPAADQSEQVRKRLEEVRSRLALTAEQEAQVRPILADEVQKLRALREKYEGGSQNRRTRLRMARDLKDIQSDADTQLKKVLTKAQMDELKKMREERRDELKSRAGR
jgi:hypothetical protein